MFETQQFGRAPGRPADESFEVIEPATPALNGKAIRKQVTDGFLVGVRTLAEDISPQRGFDIDEVVKVVTWLNRLGIDYLHVASRSVSSNSWKHPASPQTNINRLLRCP